MATEIQHHFDGDHHEVCLKSNRESSPDLEFEDQQLEAEGVSNFEFLDHNSISFGRYASESLAWEKRSVFSHDRYQEELEKFTNPGSVAQKKAYFEDYYKKIRAMKRLQAEEQGTTQLDACQDAHNSKTLVEDNGNSIVPKDNNSVNQNLISDNITLSNMDSSGGNVYVSEQAAEGKERDCNIFNDKSGLSDRVSISLSTVKAKHSIRKVSASQNLSSGSKKTSQKKSYVSNAVSHKSNEPKKHVPRLQAKGTVVSVRNETKLESSRTMKNAIKQSDKPNSNLHRQITHKVDKSRPCKQTDPKAASKNSKQITEACPTAIDPHSLLEGNKLVSSFSSVRTHQTKPSTTSQGLADTTASRFQVCAQSAKAVLYSSSIRAPLPDASVIRFPVHAQSAKRVSSSSSIRARQVKPSANPQGLDEKLPTKLAVKSQSFKGISRNETASGGLKNRIKRSATVSTPIKSSQNLGELRQRSNDLGGRQKEGKEKISVRIRRDPTAASSAGIRGDPKPTASVLSNISKASNAKLTQKIAPEPSAVDICDQKPLRPRKPSWR